MRAIVNITSGRAAKAAGWLARDVRVNNESVAPIKDVLKATPLADGSSMFDLIASNDNLKDDWALYVDGALMEGGSDITVPIKDSVQIHVWDYPFTANRDA